MDDIITRCYTNPRRIFHLPEQPETWIEVDPRRWRNRTAETIYPLRLDAF